MPETKSFTFNHKEIVEALIKQANIHDGKWQIIIEFGLAAVNSKVGENEYTPTAIIPVKNIGIMRVDKDTPLSVDASLVNPKLKPKKL